MFKSVFYHHLAKMALKSKKIHIFRLFSIVLSFRTRFQTFIAFILNSTRTIILCKYQKIGLFVNILFDYWWFLKIS